MSDDNYEKINFEDYLSTNDHKERIEDIVEEHENKEGGLISKLLGRGKKKILNHRIDNLKDAKYELKKACSEIENKYKDYYKKTDELYENYINSQNELEKINKNLRSYLSKKENLESKINSVESSKEEMKLLRKKRKNENQIRLGKVARTSQLKKVKKEKKLYSLTDKFTLIYSTMLANTRSIYETLDTQIEYLKYFKGVENPKEKLFKNSTKGLVNGLKGIDESNELLEKTLEEIQSLNNLGESLSVSENGLEEAEEKLKKFEKKVNENTQELEEKMNKQLEKLGIEFFEKEKIVDKNEEGGLDEL